MDLTALNPGDLIAFQIAPREGARSSNSGKWGVVKVLFCGADNTPVVSLLEGIFDVCPSPSQVSGAQVLQETRFGADEVSGMGLPMIFAVIKDFYYPTPHIVGIGQALEFQKIEDEAQSALAAGGYARRCAGLGEASLALDDEHRAKHDAIAWWADVEAARVRAKDADKRQAARLKGLTLEKLQARVALADWDDRGEFLPQEFVLVLRKRVRALLADLDALGDKPRRPKARKLLREFVEDVNGLDEGAGGVIETDEREELWQLIEEICWAIKQKPLLDEVDEWRAW